ncbi:TPA: hypothetical protein ACU207_002287 [Mannheimia haemolytica]|nr:hypothetical protein [Mannheimia haemolytica]MDW0618501.1 hypothetical protein [Mannheimia haemolytica]MEE3732251.1 hypothetical protein [Mannheimia haemolytica]UQX68797.1 hypothetical protein M3705_07215 [Mannheimia haemolytica]UQX80497.1 hypothetical protein M3703_04050 [Mannheimia haemolytica]SQE31406.1 Uncharacterised protein [Mannheimia haemolytica]
MNTLLIVITSSTALLLTIFVGLVTWANWDILKEDWVEKDEKSNQNKS